MASRAKPTGFINFDIVGDRHGVQAMLNRVDSALSVPGLAVFLHGSVGPWVRQRAQDRFATEGDDVTGKWAPLAQTTIEIRENAGFEGSHPINKRTGELEAYITQGQVDVDSVPGVATLKFPKDPPRTGGIRTKMQTAQGGRTNPPTVPRPVLGMNERDLGAIMTMLAFHVKGSGVTRNAAGR